MHSQRFIAPLAGLVLLLALFPCRSASAQPSVAAATQPTIDFDHLKDADKLIDDAIAAGKTPGAVLLVGRGDEVVYRKAYGNRAVEPAKIPETPDTIFDMASLTKAIATAPSIMILSDEGRLSVHDKVAKYLPEFAQNGKQDMTIEMLLLHRSGLIPDNDIKDYEHGPEEAWRNIYALAPRWTPGTHFAYSDLNYEMLGKLVEVISGEPLDQFAKEHLFEPLGMDHTRFKPPASWRDSIAPTEQRNGHWMIGEVHDPRADALGGVAGHAGVFSTADDLSRFCRMLLHHGALDGHRVLKESTLEEMTAERCLPDRSGCRGYGFDIDTPYSGCRGDRFERGTTYGHTGFTGTMLWVDPIHQCYVILLTNSVHPNGKGNVLRLRHQVATVVAETLLGKEPSTQPSTILIAAGVGPDRGPVLCGIDVLEQEHFAPLEGKRVALVTNHTGLDANGNRTVDLFAAAKNVHLAKLFSPEHGLYGLMDEKVSDTVDPKTGLHVYSLYGPTTRPTDEMLKDVDAVVYDIQDVGARYYTYTTTLGLCMEAAAAHKIPFYVLDRPNPVTGLLVDGPIADEHALGFTAYAPIPVSHGMTEGEMARMFDAERHIGCDLTVIEMKGWHRWMWWDDTGRMWVNPSPNMRNPTQALLYLGIGFLETSNLSVGRGTDQPFETFGAPWIDGRKLAAALNADHMPGLRFVPVSFTPASSKFAKLPCEGCYIEVTDRTAVEPVRAGLRIAWELKRLFGDAFHLKGIGRLLVNADTLNQLRTTPDVASLAEGWQKPLEAFERTRAKYLIYR
ncbi:MAG TPA: exo-beta-N-acetylmuramidase NamZ domain-containing protein [Tepidisphaeraceae bacterium]|jgi:uncharacterized protein YbbC (DUF1343 family)